MEHLGQSGLGPDQVRFQLTEVTALRPDRPGVHCLRCRADVPRRRRLFQPGAGDVRPVYTVDDPFSDSQSVSSSTVIF
ncbi:MAG: hypothetical protein R2856_23355 [Caldilineaceae bacterium]